MDPRVLRQAIINRVESSKTVEYSLWKIGLTHDPVKRRKQHKADGQFTEYWNQWMADSHSDAREIEAHFINGKGMKGSSGGELNARKKVYVYIFKERDGGGL